MRFLNFFLVLSFSILIAVAADGKDYSVPFYYWNTPGITDLSAFGTGSASSAINASGRIVATWTDEVGADIFVRAASSADNNATWSATATLSAAGGLGSQVAINSSNQTIAIWTLTTGAQIQAAYSSDGGATWSSAINLSNASFIAGGPQIALNDSGQAIAVFFNMVGFDVLIQASYSTNGGATWLVPGSILTLSAADQSASPPQVAINASGQAIAVWSRSNGANQIVQARYSADGGATWAAVANLSATLQDATAPQIAINASGQAIAVWSRSNGAEPDKTIIQAAYSTDGGSWTTVDLSNVEQDATVPQIAINASNQAIAVWSRSNGTNTIIQAAYSIDGGQTWSTPVNLSAAGQNAFTPQIALNDSNWALATWSRSDGSNTIIQSAYSLNRGGVWSANANLSATGESAYIPLVALNASGRSSFIWGRGPEGAILAQVTNGYSTAVAVKAVQSTMRFPLSKDLVNKMTWPTMSEVSSFKVYGNTELTESLGYQSVGSTFSDHQMKRGLEKYYYFTVIANSVESPSVKMTLP